MKTYRIDLDMNYVSGIAHYTIVELTRDIAGRGYDETVIGSFSVSDEIYTNFLRIISHSLDGSRAKKLERTIKDLEKQLEEAKRELNEFSSKKNSETFHHPV